MSEKYVVEPEVPYYISNITVWHMILHTRLSICISQLLHSDVLSFLKYYRKSWIFPTSLVFDASSKISGMQKAEK